MEEAYQKYCNFQFENCKEWKEYCNRLDPIPPPSLLEKYKKRWFKAHIDSNLDFDGKFITSSIPQSTQNQPQVRRQFVPVTNSYSQLTNKILDLLKALLYMLMYEAYILTVVLSQLSLKDIKNLEENYNYVFFFKGKYMLIALLACLVSLTRKKGMIQFNFNYLKSILFEDDLQTVFYIFFFLILDGGCVQLVPMLIPTILALEAVSPQKLAIKIQSKRFELIQIKHELEVFLGFIFLFGWLMGIYWFLTSFLYWQFLRVRYAINNTTKQIFKDLRKRLDKMFSSPRFVNWIWVRVIKVILWSSKIEFNKEGQSKPLCSVL